MVNMLKLTVMGSHRFRVERCFAHTVPMTTDSQFGVKSMTYIALSVCVKTVPSGTNMLVDVLTVDSACISHTVLK